MGTATKNFTKKKRKEFSSARRILMAVVENKFLNILQRL